MLHLRELPNETIMGSEGSFTEVKGDTTMDAAEKKLNELGYKQELRREMTMFKTLAISFSTMTLITGITPLYGSGLKYAGPATLVWGWVVVSFFSWDQISASFIQHSKTPFPFGWPANGSSSNFSL